MKSDNKHGGGRFLARLGLAWMVAWGLLASPTADAHARLLRSSPAAEVELGSAPRVIALWFNEQPEAEFSSIKLLDGTGEVLVEGAPSRTADANGLELRLPETLPAGEYRVRYRVLSVDGHVIEDGFGFRIGTP